MLLGLFRIRVFQPHISVCHSLFLQNRRPFSSKMDAKGQHRVQTTERLAKLRELMKQKGLEAFVVPSEDQRTSTKAFLLAPNSTIY